jgi:superfamily II DNA/RNA helicase
MGRSIVFTRTRHGADRLAKQMDKLGVAAVALHGGRSQNQRNAALSMFASGRVKALIATDVAARGIHVEAVASVVHFDLPPDANDYLHRSGRTARAGATGTIVSMVSRDQQRAARRIQQDLGLSAPIDPPRLESLHDGGHAVGALSEKRPRRELDAPDSTAGRAYHRVAGAESLYVANLPWGTTDQDLATLFGRHGKVHQTTIITDRRTGRSRGFAFVDMHAGDAHGAVEALHGSSMDGRDLTVRVARPRRRYG